MWLSFTHIPLSVACRYTSYLELKHRNKVGSIAAAQPLPPPPLPPRHGKGQSEVGVDIWTQNIYIYLYIMSVYEMLSEQYMSALQTMKTFFTQVYSPLSGEKVTIAVSKAAVHGKLDL